MIRTNGLLGIFAKAPSAGQAKTRLAQATSREFAQLVAAAFLEDSLDRFSDVQAARALVYAPARAASYFTGVSQGRYELIPQSDGDLGDRLRAFFVQAHANGYINVIAVGTDSPTMPAEWIERAFRLLESHDVVIGPALDGGYYLIGMGPKEIDAFADIPWSTPRVLEKTVERVQAAPATLALLPPWYDVDTAVDWAMLRGHVLALRQAGIDPGVPRVEALLAGRASDG